MHEIHRRKIKSENRYIIEHHFSKEQNAIILKHSRRHAIKTINHSSEYNAMNANYLQYALY